MKEKIIARLRALFPGVNLSKSRIDAICNADKLSITEETEETEIDQKLKDLNELVSFSEIAKNDDWIRAAKAKEKKDPNQEPANPKNQDPEKPEEAGLSPEVKALMETVKTLTQTVSTMQAGKTTESRKQILETKLKDAQPKFKEKILKDFSRMQFEKDEDFDAYLTETETDLTEFNQSLSDQGLGQSKAPFQPAGSGSSQTALKSDIEAWAKQNAPAEVVK
jgi:hypothetical protein